MQSRIPTKTNSLSKLKEMGLPVPVILDVGVQYATPELMKVFPGARHILFEPVREYHDSIRRSYEAAGIQYEIVDVAAAGTDEDRTLELSTYYEGMEITHARFAGSNSSGENLREVKAARLDTLVAGMGLEGPFLLKVDVDGAEPEILAGATEVLKSCSALIIETTIENFFNITQQMMASTGLVLFDVVDLCYHRGALRQVDLVFLRSAALPKEVLAQHYSDAEFSVDDFFDLSDKLGAKN